jgi:hypothetical protein
LSRRGKRCCSGRGCAAFQAASERSTLESFASGDNISPRDQQVALGSVQKTANQRNPFVSSFFGDSMSDRIYKVFVSSTLEDLRDERAEVQTALLKLNCLPVGMELFPAADDETWEFIKTQIVDSDYYVLLVAGRYGSLGPHGVSFTEMEFEYAQEMRIPTIAFVHGKRGSIPLDKSETDTERAGKLKLFIAKVRTKPVRYFATPQELALEVTTSFVDLKTRKPAVGFVRADQAVDFKKYSEVLEANRELERRLQELSLNSSQELAHWFDEKICLGIERFGSKVNVTASWRDIALLVAPYLAAGCLGSRIEDERRKRIALS